jgi:anti-anti-sigma factor
VRVVSAEGQTPSAAERLRHSGRPEGAYCSCTATALSSPAGEILVIRIVGQVDHATVADVAAVLDDAVERYASHLVIDLVGVNFCAVDGTTLIVQAGRRAAQHGTGYCVSGAPQYVRRVWTLLWPEDLRPTRYPSTAAAVQAAITEQAERLGRIRPIEPDDDRPLADRAHAGDVEAYRELVLRHRRRMYSSALRTLGESDDPDDVARDIAARMHTALAVFSAVDH